MKIEVINPANKEIAGSYELETEEQVFAKLTTAHERFKQWRKSSFATRKELFAKLVTLLNERTEQYAQLMSMEMGKSMIEARAEVKKCAWMTEVYVERGEEWLANEEVSADGVEHYVSFEPLGVIFSIMPWNFPFWQVLRFAVPTIFAGNVSLLKHSNQVPGSSQAIEQLFKDAGFPDGVFQSLIIDHTLGEKLMARDEIRGISFTGSTEVGSRIAEVAGKNLKKVVLELGGSDPFIVFADADLKKAAEVAVTGRFQNCGQSCIAAKRFIVEESVAEEFAMLFAQELAKRKVGDPTICDIGPLVNQSSFTEIIEQVEDAKRLGARVVTGGEVIEHNGYFYRPTILLNTTKEMRVVKEEVFGPVAPIITFQNEQEAIELANDTPFGLGGSIWSKDLRRAKRLAKELECGSVFVNSMVKSDPRMPFGGVKKSGLGRELARYGLMEFVNIKGNNIYE